MTELRHIIMRGKKPKKTPPPASWLDLPAMPAAPARARQNRRPAKKARLPVPVFAPNPYAFAREAECCLLGIRDTLSTMMPTPITHGCIRAIDKTLKLR